MRHVKALGALLVLLALLFGIPAVLGATIGNPARGWTDLKAGDLTNEVLIDLFAVIVWVAWAQFALSVLVEAAAAVRQLPLPGRIPLVPGLSQQLARALVGAVLLAGTVAATLTAPVHAFASPAAPAPTVAAQLETSSAPSARAAERQLAAVPRPAGPSSRIYVVPHGGEGPDTYWDIAASFCGGGPNWASIWDLNRGRRQADGQVMTEPGLLKAGWTVLIPTGAGHSRPNQGHEQAVTVEPGDTLSGIAAAHGIGDWHQVWQASKHMAEPDGGRLTDPDLIQPGWTVEVPVPAAATEPTTSPISPPTSPRIPPPPSPQPPSPGAFPPGAPRTADHPAPAIRPAPAPSHASPHAAGPPAAEAGRSAEMPILAFAGGGALLAGMSLAAMIRYRRRQLRWRRPGHTISATPPQLLPAERALRSTGSAALADVTWLNEALRSLVHALSGTEGGRLPDVLAARLTDQELELILAGPQPGAPAPWRPDESGVRWRISRADSLPYDPADREHHFAPFPALASVGYTVDGEHWLLDLERIAAMSLAGDPERCLNLARFLAAELAHNPWSEMLQVTLAGFGAEMAQINPERLTYTDDLAAVITDLERQLGSGTDTIREGDIQVLPGRLHNIAAEDFAPHVLLIAPGTTENAAALARLLAAMKSHGCRTSIALVLVDSQAHADATRWQLNVDAQGVLRIPALNLELIAQQIPAGEAAQLAQLLALAASTEDRPIPPAPGDKPWEHYADATGALRTENTAAAQPEPAGTAGSGGLPPSPPADSAPRGAGSVLPLPLTTYLRHTASTEADINALAPPVGDQIRGQVESADPQLNADLADWYDPACTRPKLTLLGPVNVRAQGPLPERNPRLQWNTEVVAYLASRPNGVSTERYATDLWPDDPEINGKTKVRQSIWIVRKWLGTNQRTGSEHLPKGLAPGRGDCYRVEDALVDAELCRRLRLRGTATGAAGISDLQAALDMVVGVPFDHRRPGGYGWLADTPLDHEYAGMIVDLAHTLATHHLGAQQPVLAARAAHVALCAGSSEDVPLLDLVAACDAQDNRAEADTYVKRILSNHDAEVEEDLPPRTAQILFRRQRVDQAS